MKINKKLICHIYILLWCVYNLQGSLYAVGSRMGRMLLAVILVISIYYFFIANMKYKLPKVLKILTVLILAWTVYGVIPMVVGTSGVTRKVQDFMYLKGIYMSLLPIYTFYVFVRRGWLTEDLLRRWIIVFIMVAITCFYSNETKLMQRAEAKGADQEDFTNNVGYTLLSVLPLIPLLWRKPILQYVLLGVCLLYVLMGFKRGAIIAGIVATVWFLYVSTSKIQKQETFRKKGLRLLLTIILVVGTVVVVQNLLSMNSYFNRRIERTLEGDSSGRDVLYSTFYNHFVNESNVLRFLFGNGAYGTLKISSHYAHNDWLEIAIDNGLILLILYMAYWLSFIKTMLRVRRYNKLLYLMMGEFFIIYFLRTFYSMSYNNISIYATSALGYAMAVYMRPNCASTNDVINKDNVS